MNSSAATSETGSELDYRNQPSDDIFIYLFNGGFELVQSFVSKFYKPSMASFQEQLVIKKLTENFQSLFTVILEEATKPSQLLDYCSFLQVLLIKTGKSLAVKKYLKKIT